MKLRHTYFIWNLMINFVYRVLRLFSILFAWFFETKIWSKIFKYSAYCFADFTLCKWLLVVLFSMPNDPSTNRDLCADSNAHLTATRWILFLNLNFWSYEFICFFFSSSHSIFIASISLSIKMHSFMEETQWNSFFFFLFFCDRSRVIQ